MLIYEKITKKVHRLIPSKFPPIQLFDWAESKEELEQIAELESMTNPRIKDSLGDIHVIPEDEWIGGEGTTPIMAAFTHIGHPSRFSDGRFGIYYAAESIETAIKETVYHRERFYRASQEAACSISMRQYITKVVQPLVRVCQDNHQNCLNPDPDCYSESQKLGQDLRNKKEWGVYYPSIRDEKGTCVAILRPKALEYPVTQGAHFRYFWDGFTIYAVYKESQVKNIIEVR